MRKAKLNVVKIGGNVINQQQSLRSFLKLFASMEEDKVLVHGGGREATTLAKALNVETRMIDGRRVTDGETLNIVTMVYAGLINKRIVSLLQAEGCDAIGLSGADANLIRAVRRNPEPVDYGYVGDVKNTSVNSLQISSFLSDGLTPAICAITHDGAGQLLNTNADSVAMAVATAMADRFDVTLTFCFEMPGVLSDPNDASSIIPHITPDIFMQLSESGIINAGMIPKLSNSFKALQGGVSRVIIKNHLDLLDEGVGTIIEL